MNNLQPPLYFLIAVVVLAALVYLLWKVLIPWITLEMKRVSSRSHPPQPQEVWMQDSTLLYIEAVHPHGVELMAYDPATRKVDRWIDTWSDWQLRLKLRSVYFTGMRRPLGPAS